MKTSYILEQKKISKYLTFRNEENIKKNNLKYLR